MKNIFKKLQNRNWFGNYLSQYCSTIVYNTSWVTFKIKNKTAILKLVSSDRSKERMCSSSVQIFHLISQGDDVIADSSDGCFSLWRLGCFLSFALGFGHQTDMRQEQFCWRCSTPQLMDQQRQQKQSCFWNRENKNFIQAHWSFSLKNVIVRLKMILHRIIRPIYETLFHMNSSWKSKNKKISTKSPSLLIFYRIKNIWKSSFP